MRIHSRHRQRHQLSEINVVPYIDVMLVLLVIFMITVPLNPASLPVQLADAGQSSDEEIYFIVIEAGGTILAGESQQPVSIAQLRQQSGQVLAAKPKIRFALHAQDSVPYGELLSIMNVLREIGASKVGLVQTAR